MRIGVYVDGFNLYYGARGLCGRGTPGWRWLDLRGLAADLVGRRTSWAGAQVERVVYCTARIDAAGNPSGHADQDVYIKALLAADSVDHIEYGTYVARVRTAPLAVKDPRDGPARPPALAAGGSGRPRRAGQRGGVHGVLRRPRGEGLRRQRRGAPAARPCRAVPASQGVVTSRPLRGSRSP